MRRLAALAAGAAAALSLCVAGPAYAAERLDSLFQDDDELLHADPATVRSTLDTLRDLGVDRLRVTVLWKGIAPAARPPGFDASDPAAYEPSAWERFDRVVIEARARGMDVLFNLTGPGPLWAHGLPPRPDIADTFDPARGEFGSFVTAVGRRYSGSFTPRGGSEPLPRVAWWSIWNEPNHSGWLTPTWLPEAGTFFERSASLYRELVDSAWAALDASGHGSDVVLIGETAPKGDGTRNVKRVMHPTTFVRALYCVDERLRPLRGSHAGQLSCPADRLSFRRAHPGLFAASGFAHHPYEPLHAPGVRPLRREYVTLSSLNRLTRMLDGIFRGYGVRRRVALHLTEYGYQTAPDRHGVGLRAQAAYLNQAAYMAWKHPRVRSLAQFLLVDDGEPVGLTFQSGLISRAGVRKPAFPAYRLPIWLPRPRVRRGRSVLVWAMLRPARNGASASAVVEFRAAGLRRYRRLARVRVSSPRNVLLTRVVVPRSGHLRVRYRPPRAARVLSSRGAFVRVLRR